MKRLHWILLPLGLSILVLSEACAPSQPSDEDPGADSRAAAPVPATDHDTTRTHELPAEFANLQVLPADISKDELKRTMKLITRSLGTKCDHCHLTDVRDFASDERREKVVAREMMRMVERINRELLTWEDAPEATCFMCHHGQHKPQRKPDGMVSTEARGDSSQLSE